jgi:hypothetical protein
MCRSIRTLRSSTEPATSGEIRAAARQFVRKVGGVREPSARNRDAFEAAIAEIASASERLILALGGGVEEGPDRKPHPRPQPLAGRLAGSRPARSHSSRAGAA